ncbi:MAG: retropepsin-like aspartic protease [Pseudomonadota bacterium]
MGRTGKTFLLVGFWLAVGLVLYLFFLRQERPPIQVVGADSVELTRARDGHYHIDGAIQGGPVQFLIDTGASTVSVSGAEARRLGLECRVASTFSTANGTVEGCTARAATLDFGPFRLEQVAVAVLPDLAGGALLGMNALRHLRLEQADNTLRMSLPAERANATPLSQ